MSSDIPRRQRHAPSGVNRLWGAICATYHDVFHPHVPGRLITVAPYSRTLIRYYNDLRKPFSCNVVAGPTAVYVCWRIIEFPSRDCFSNCPILHSTAHE